MVFRSSLLVAVGLAALFLVAAGLTAAGTSTRRVYLAAVLVAAAAQTVLTNALAFCAGVGRFAVLPLASGALFGLGHLLTVWMAGNEPSSAAVGTARILALGASALLTTAAVFATPTWRVMYSVNLRFPASPWAYVTRIH